MTTKKNGLNGHNGSQQRWEITELVSCGEAAWSGRAANGFAVHISYRIGLLRVEVAEPSQAHPGGCAWRDLLVARADYLELEFGLLRERDDSLCPGPGSLDALRRERRAVADWMVLGECRSDQRNQSPSMTFWRLRSVLNLRDEHFDQLARAGVAGGPERVVITALLDGAPSSAV